MPATTERQGAGPARPRVAPPRLHVTAVGALATFLLALAVLAWQMASGRDPVLGHGFAAATPPREIIVRRVVVTRVQPTHVVVVRTVRHARAATAAAPPPRPAVVRTVVARRAPAPVQRVSAPAPKPPAPAPKPKPAPPTTHQS